MATKVALVTGATGFIGSHLTRRLIMDGWAVHIIVRFDSSLELLQDMRDKIFIHYHDGSTINLMGIVNKSRPDTVFHLASLFLAQHDSGDVEKLIRSNILFGTQLLEAMAVHGVTKLINTGTSWQHYQNCDYNPVCLYAATKQAFEMIIDYYVGVFSFKAISLKLFDTYGPDDPRPKIFNLLKKVEADNVTLEMSPGEQLIDLVYIDDVINAFLLANEQLGKSSLSMHQRYMVSSNNPITLKDLVKKYEDIIGKKLPINWGGRSYRPREVMIPWNNGELLPCWSPVVSLEEGIKMTYKV
jgi:nucleoside-diphosphate-sugar epimerase